MTEETETRPPHQWVASKIDFSVAGVSLLRSGSRLPSFDTMMVIEKAFNWSMARQVRARGRKDYATEFEKILEARYAEERGHE